MGTPYPEWTTACLDWAERIAARQSIIPPPIFPDEAEAALAIFKSLQVTDLAKTVVDEYTGELRSPNFGECADEWVFDFVRAIFGAYDAETGNQLIREFYLLIAKKNTKSTIAAGIMLTALILCWRNDEEHLILAPTKEVAENSFKPAASMVRADPELDALLQVQDHIRTITHRVTRASLKVVAADTDTVSGKKSGRILIDEHWIFGKRPNADAMIMEATGGLRSRPEGWVIYLTTQSDEPPAGVFKQKLDYYRDVRDGVIHDPRRLGVLYEFPKAMIASKAYLDPENFYIPNPNMGRSVTKIDLEDELRMRQSEQDGSFQKFLAKHLNVQIGTNLRADRWAGADFWEAAGKHRRLTLRDLMDACEVIDMGIDGGGLDDLLALSATGRTPEGKWLTWSHAWANPTVLERRKKEAARFLDFEKDGDLTVVKTPGDDVVQLAAMVGDVYRSGLLDLVGVDQHGLGGILDALEAEGVPADKIVGISQGWKLSATIKTAERKLNEGVIEHANQPLMAWCVGNAKTVPAGNAVNITKQVSGSAKIDPLMSFFSSVELMSRNPASPKKQYQMLVFG